MRYKFWTSEEVEALEWMIKHNWSLDQLDKVLENRSATAIINRIRRDYDKEIAKKYHTEHYEKKIGRKIKAIHWTSEELEALEWMVYREWSLEQLDNVLEKRSVYGIIHRIKKDYDEIITSKYIKECYQRPEVKQKRKEYYQRYYQRTKKEKSTKYFWTSEELEALEWMVYREWSLEQLDNVLEKRSVYGIIHRIKKDYDEIITSKYIKECYQRPEVKEYHKEYYQKIKKKRAREYYEKNKLKEKSARYWTSEELEALEWMVYREWSLEQLDNVLEKRNAKAISVKIRKNYDKEITKKYEKEYRQKFKVKQRK